MIVRRGVGRAAGVGVAPGFILPSVPSSSPSPSTSPSSSPSRSLSPSASASPSSSVSPSPSPSDGGFAISNVSGTLSHGSTLTITGSGFGTKSTAAPFIWDSCDGSGDPGDLWNETYPTTAGGIYDLQYITPSALGQGVALPFNRGTKYMAGCHKNLNDSNGGNLVAMGFTYTKDFTKPTYLNYWWRIDPNWQDSGEDQNLKLWNATAGSSAFSAGYCYLEILNSTFFGAGSGDVFLDINEVGIGYDGQHYGGIATPNPADGWHQWEHFINWGSGTNGRHRLYVDGTLCFDSLPCATDTASGTARSELIGDYSRSRGVDNFRYFKHVYVDRSFARVIIGNASSLSSCTIREPQIISAWSGSSITVTANLGKHANGASVYFFVVGSDNVATVGFPATLA